MIKAERMSEPKKCEALGCEEPARGRGVLCNMHRIALRKGHEVYAVRYTRQNYIQNAVCATPGCSGTASSSVLCAPCRNMRARRTEAQNALKHEKKPCRALGCAQSANYGGPHCTMHKSAKKAGFDVDNVEYTRQRVLRHSRTKRRPDGACAKPGCVERPETSQASFCSAHRVHQSCGYWTRDLFDQCILLAGGKCAICEKEFANSSDRHRDHDHATDKPRGLLCRYCNTRLGQFERFRALSTPTHNDTPEQRAACEPFERYLRNTPVMQLEALKEPEAAE